MRGCPHLSLSLQPLSIVCTSSHTIGERLGCCQPALFALGLHSKYYPAGSPLSSVPLSSVPLSSVPLSSCPSAPRSQLSSLCPNQAASAVNIASVATESDKKGARQAKKNSCIFKHLWMEMIENIINKETSQKTLYQKTSEFRPNMQPLGRSAEPFSFSSFSCSRAISRAFGFTAPTPGTLPNACTFRGLQG